MLRLRNRVLKIPERDYKKCKKTWCNDMMKLFNILDKMSIFEEKTSCNIRELQICSDNIWKEKWKNNLPNKSKLRTYISFKE